MSNNHWQLLEDIQQNMKQASDLPRGILNGVAERLDEALTGSSRASIEALNAQLTGLLEYLLSLEPATAQAILGAQPDHKNEQAAYIIGQVSFAQLLAAQAAERRVDDEFTTWMSNNLFKSYIDALARKDLNGKELAEICNEVPETVSRKLKQLRELGITEFRREGTSFYNFLTPAARSVLAESKPLDVSNRPKLGVVKLREAIPSHMQHGQSLARAAA
jgi:DNA-binding transcriptional ArsR family regulator